MAYRTFKRHLTAADRRAKEVIKSCVESGAGIDYIADAPNFRYTPAPPTGTSFVGRENCGPSKRSSIACGRGNTLKLKTWSPSKLDANPMYQCPMRGDPPALEKARQAWADGDPRPLRAYLEAEACKRRYEAQKAEVDATYQLELAEAA